LKETKRCTGSVLADRVQPMGQRNIPVWEVLICMVWQSADDDIADESERAVLDLNKILAIPL